MRRPLTAIAYSALLVWLLGFTPAANASTYYVAPGGRDTNAGTQAAPWATIQRAADLMLPGDTVIILPGVYVEAVNIQRSGTQGSYITYQAMPGAAMESPNPALSLEALDIWPGVSYIRLTGFELRGGFDETIYVRQGSHHVEILDCDIHHNRSGVVWYGSSNGLIAGCRIHDNEVGGVAFRAGAHDILVQDTDSYNHDDGLACSGDADGFGADETTYNLTFEGSRAFGNSEDGFDLKADNAVIVRSVSSNNNCVGAKLWNNATLQDSLIHGNGTGVKGSSVVSGGGTVLRLINNTVAANALGIALGGSLDKPYSVELFNNIVSGDGKALDFLDCVNLTENFNIFHRPDPGAEHIIERIGCISTSNSNRFSGPQINNGGWYAHSGQGANSRAADPLYVAPVVGDFSLKPSSPAIGMGWSAVASAVDLNGTPRPQGNGFDLGAYEYASVSTVATLSVTKTGTAGTVTSSPGGISCGASCVAPFGLGTVLTLTASPAVGSNFSGWSGGGCGGTGPCTVTLTGDRAVTATFTASQASQKDVVIDGLAVSVASAVAGGQVTVSYQVKNQGTGVVTETYTDRLYLSSDATLSSGDVLLGTSHGHTADLAPGATHGHSQAVTIPGGTTAGSYFILVEADALRAVAEGNEGNNTASIALAVTQLKKDLVIEGLAVSVGSVVAGRQVTVSYRVTNRGTAVVTETYTDRIALSVDTILGASDALLGTSHGHTADLVPNATHAHSQVVTVPPGTPPGAYFIVVQADYLGLVSEGDEGNNVTPRMLTVTAP